MILRSLLALLALSLPQGPQRFEVSARDERVSADSVAIVERLVEEGLERLGPMFPRAGHGRFRVVLHRTEASMPRHLRAAHHPGSPGLAFLSRGEIHLFLSLMGLEPPNDLRSVVDHELVHILLHEQAGAAGAAIPRWFHEGLAQELAGGAWHGFKEEDLVYRVATSSLLPFGELRRDFPHNRMDLAYGQSWSFVAFLVRRFGLPRLLSIVEEVDDETDFRAAFFRALEHTRYELQDEWENYLLWDSGAGARSLYRNCFSLLMVLAVPILGLAFVRRLRRERAMAARLEAEDRRALQEQLQGPPWPPPADAAGLRAPETPWPD